MSRRAVTWLAVAVVLLLAVGAASYTVALVRTWDQTRTAVTDITANRDALCALLGPMRGGQGEPAELREARDLYAKLGCARLGR